MTLKTADIKSSIFGFVVDYCSRKGLGFYFCARLLSFMTSDLSCASHSCFLATVLAHIWSSQSHMHHALYLTYYQILAAQLVLMFFSL